MRQFISECEADKNGILLVCQKDFFRFKKVLRSRVGDMIFVRFPSGALKKMTICKIDDAKKNLTLQICGNDFFENQSAKVPFQASQKIQNQKLQNNFFCAEENLEIENYEHENSKFAENFVQIFLFQFIAKNSKMDLIVRQATECGIQKIIPVVGDFSQKFFSQENFRTERFSRIIKSACEQSGSAVKTQVLNAMTVENSIKFWKKITENLCDLESLALVLYERNENSISMANAILNSKNVKKIALFVGAEGGISPHEIEEFVASNFKIVHLKTNILRCETAALYGIAALQSFYWEKGFLQWKE